MSKQAKAPKTGEAKINGVTYKFQHPGVRWYLRNTDESRGPNGQVNIEKYTQNLLDNVVVEPAGLKIDDFDSVSEVEELTAAVERFLKS